MTKKANQKGKQTKKDPNLSRESMWGELDTLTKNRILQNREKPVKKEKQDGLVATHSTPPATWERERTDRGITTIRTRKINEKKKRKNKEKPKNPQKREGWFSENNPRTDTFRTHRDRQVDYKPLV